MASKLTDGARTNTHYAFEVESLEHAVSPTRVGCGHSSARTVSWLRTLAKVSGSKTARADTLLKKVFRSSCWT